MLSKVIVLFFVFIAVLAMIGKLRLPKVGRGKDAARLEARKCPKCGTFRIGRGPCPCGHE